MFLNARSVPKDPMKDVNACEELLVKYSEALIVTAFKTLNVEFKDKGLVLYSLVLSLFIGQKTTKKK